MRITCSASCASDAFALERLGVIGPDGVDGRAPRALDLGCGSGFHSAALFALGFEVTAVDLVPALLAELRARHPMAIRAGTLRPIQGNFLDRELYADRQPFEVVVLMGDTLTHLASVDEVDRVICHAAAMLRSGGGRLILRFRDLTRPLTGTDRFVLVRADADRIMTCFVEDSPADPAHATITDLIYRRRSAQEEEAAAAAGAAPGPWQLEKSSYQKLRIDGATVRRLLAGCGLKSTHEEAQGNLLTLVALAP